MLNGIFFETPIENNFLGHQMAEIYKEQVYAPFLVGRKDLVIFDIGANIGMASYYFSQFAKQVYAFEPALEHFNTLKFMLDFNKITNVLPHKLAITNEDSQATLLHQQNKTMYSLRPALPTEGQETVDTIRLDTFMTSRKIDHVDFMKLDVEGLEPEIICGDGFQKIASKIDMIFMETHSWMARNPNQLREALKMAGFNTSDIPNDATLLIAKRS